MPDIHLTVSTSGDSLCINVPVALASHFGLVKSTKVHARYGDGLLVIYPVQYYNRRDLLNSSTPESVPVDEWDLDQPA
jgi:antitoxin component of MazEF toxin-antitoxin module